MVVVVRQQGVNLHTTPGHNGKLHFLDSELLGVAELPSFSRRSRTGAETSNR